MEQRHENKIRMSDTVWIVLQNFMDLWKNNEGFVEVVNDFGDNIKAVNAARSPSDADTTGITADKGVMQEDVIDSIMEISGPLRTIAKRPVNNELKSQVTFTDTMLEDLTEAKLAETGLKVAELARKNLVAIKRFGVTEADITHLETISTSYGAKIPEPRTAVVARSSAKKSLSQLVRETNQLLKEDLDGPMHSYRRKNPEFCNNYFTARHVVNYGVRHEKKEDTATKK